MDKVHYHTQAHPVCLVNQRLELVRRTEPGRSSEEIRDLVPERSVVRVLHNRHKLQRVIACLGDPRQDVRAKLIVGSHPKDFLGHTNVSFVDHRKLRSLRRLMTPRIDLGRIPELGVKNLGLGILDNTASPDRYAVQAMPGVMDLQAVQAFVSQNMIAYRDLPLPVGADAVHPKLLRLPPSGNVPDDKDRVGPGRPLPDNPPVALGVYSEMLMPQRKVRQVAG